MTEAGKRLLEMGRVTPPSRVADMPWPASCDDCGLVTEDPDAYVVDDEEVTPERCCPETGSEHRWAILDGVVRYVRPRDIAAIEAEAVAAERARIAAAVLRVRATYELNPTAVIALNRVLDAATPKP